MNAVRRLFIMILEELISPGSVLCNVHARSKKHALEILSELLANPNPDIANEEIFAKLIERERLGCTSLDRGIAFPHCRISGAQNSCGALMKLSEPVDFDSLDGVPVDLIFGLILPKVLDDSHYADIDTVTGYLTNETLAARLRSAISSSELYEALFAANVPASMRMRSMQGS
ncbi:MAG: PTS sugar transporter subunit IIA [Woeseia sp.]